MTLQIEKLQCGYDVTLFTLEQLHLQKGEAVTVVGQNGCGKSTFLRTLCGLHSPLAGEVRLDGQRVGAMTARERAHRVTMLLQLQTLDNSTTVEELVSLGRTPYLGRFGYLSKTDKAAISEAIRICDVENLKNKPLGKISGGERQRARLAMVLAQQTPVVLLDEPTNHLDVSHRFALYEIVARIRRELECVVVMVCHSLEDARRFADQTLLVQNGTTQRFSAAQFSQLKEAIQQSTGIPDEWVY